MSDLEMLANFTSSVLNATMGNTTEAMPTAPPRRIGSSARSDLAFYYQCVLAPVGIITNILNLIGLRRFRKGALSVYLSALSCIDLVFSLNLVVSTYYRTLRWTESYWFAQLYSKTVIPINSIFGHLTGWVAVIIAADRVLHVVFPMKARVWVNPFRAKIVVGVVLGVLLILRSPIFFYFTANSGTLPSGLVVYWASWDPFFFTPLGRALFFTQATIFDFIPSGLLVALNIVIIIFFRRYLQKRAKLIEGRSKDAVDEAQQELKLTITLSMVMLSSLIGSMPVNISRLVFAKASEGVIYKDIASFLFILDHTSNFFIYFLSNSEFRNAILGYLPKGCCTCMKDAEAPSVGTGSSSKNASIRRAQASIRRTEVTVPHDGVSTPDAEVSTPHVEVKQ